MDGGKVKNFKSETQFTLINVYEPTPTSNKKELWNEISIYLETNPLENIFIWVDFNAILDFGEKIGGILTISQVMLDFKDWFAKEICIDIPTTNGTFTWNNRGANCCNLVERLDRFVFKGNFNSFNQHFGTIILPNARSYHYLVRLEIGEPHKPLRNPFKCEKCGF